MKNYNEKLLNATKKVSEETLKKSMNTVDKLTHPSPKVAKVGSTIGKTVGIGLIVVGTASALYGQIWGIGSCIAGVTTVVSNAIKNKK